MIRAAVLLLSLVAAMPVHAVEVVWRSSSSGVLPSPAATSTPTIPIPPEAPAGFSIVMSGEASVAAGAVLDLRPVITGASGSIVSYLLFGALPLGVTFDSGTGRIGGKALKAGTYPVWVSAGDSTGASVTAEVVIVVT
ncbi:putative Ig domain-containing protein [Agrobacterium salinitolerans]|uniref:putative Ig domain-containing protein n=1 Tax=Agrobacterium salinitolerans TaxID=1183413 RepID=UPI0022B853FF|nr:putative Ig domain-containing protein [Agrobacterium salinitolerans]MCZ7973955.1 putative Ig domain-containing protein [Agrobacterium salinitolerans]